MVHELTDICSLGLIWQKIQVPLTFLGLLGMKRVKNHLLEAFQCWCTAHDFNYYKFWDQLIPSILLIPFLLKLILDFLKPIFIYAHSCLSLAILIKTNTNIPSQKSLLQSRGSDWTRLSRKGWNQLLIPSKG